MSISAFITGIGGSLFAQYFLYLDPTHVISPELSFQFRAAGRRWAGSAARSAPVARLVRDHAAVRAAAVLSRPCRARPASRHLRAAVVIVVMLYFPERHCRGGSTRLKPHPTKKSRHDRAAGGAPSSAARFGPLWAVRRRELRGPAGASLLGLIGPKRRRQKSTLYNLNRRRALPPTAGEAVLVRGANDF